MQPCSPQSSVWFETARDGRVVLVGLEGQFEAAGAPALETEFDAALGDGRSGVVVDMRGVSVIDSKTLRTLVLTIRRAEEHNHTVVVIRPNAVVWRSLEVSGLDSSFASCCDLKEALGQLRLVTRTAGTSG